MKSELDTPTITQACQQKGFGAGAGEASQAATKGFPGVTVHFAKSGLDYNALERLQFEGGPWINEP